MSGLKGGFTMRMSVALAAALVLGCDGGGGDGPSGNPGTIQVAVSPASLSVEQGSSGTVTVTLVRGGGFSAEVAVAVSGLPSGVAVTVTPERLTGATTQAQVGVAVASTVAPGSYTATVTASATGVGSATATYQLTVTAAPNYALTVAPAALTIGAGASGQTTVNIDRTNFATGPVALTLLNPPAGITGTFVANPATTNASALTVAVASGVLPGSYNLTVQGTAAPGVRTTTLALTVTVPSTIALAAAPTALTVTQGQAGNVNLTLTRTNYTGQVSFAATNVPTGVTPSFTPATTGGNTSVLGLAVAGNAPLGTFAITITAAGTGVTAAVAQVTLTISPPVAGGNTEFQFCSVSDTPIFFAAQDGTGAWQRVTGTTAGSTTRFTFNITQNRGGVMFVHQRSTSTVVDALAVNRSANRVALARALTERKRAAVAMRTAPRTRTLAANSFADFYETTVLFASAAELIQAGTDNCATSQASKTVTGTVAGVGAGQTSILSLGGSVEGFVGGLTNNPVTFTDVPPGLLDFVGSRTNLLGVPDRLVLFRNLTIADGGALPQVIDFAGPASSVPASASITVTNSLGHELDVATFLTTANNPFSILSLSNDPDVATTLPWYGLSQATAISTDIHGVLVGAVPLGNSDLSDRAVMKYVGAVGNQTIALGPTITAPTTSQLAAGPYPRFRFQGNLPIDYQKYFDLYLSPEGTSGNEMTISATGAYLAAAGSASAYDLSVPDVAGLAGFPAASRLAIGNNDVETFAYGWTGSGLFQQRPTVGQEMKWSSTPSTLVVP